MNNESTGFPRGDIRVSDAERDQAVAELSEHFQTGRLTQEEFEERSGRAFQARTAGDLRALFTDLPRSTTPAAHAGGPTAQGSGYVRAAGRVPVARVVIACVIAAIIASNLFGNAGRADHGGFGWLVPVVILGFVLLRCARRRG